MKKLFLMLAFTGIVGAASATSIAAISNTNIITLGGEDKKGDEKKKKASKKDAKACADSKTETKSCTKGEAKSCCKSKTAAAAKVETAPATTTKK